MRVSKASIGEENEMDADVRSVSRDKSRLSSSTARQEWSRLPQSYVPPSGDAGPSHQAGWWHYDPFPEDDTVLNHHSSAPHEAHRDTQQARIAPNLTARPSFVPTQPVLVRAYSGNAVDEPKTKLSTMSLRRLFPFTGSRSTVSPRPSGPPLPSDKDFSIDSILQAIDPDIRGTLDSIAEICGRSKLSLANEYGSHIAPLGEIRAPSGGGLVPVEEASSSDGRRADEGVNVFDDDPVMMDSRGDMHPFSFYRYLENLRHAATALERDGGPTSMMAAQSALSHGQSISAAGGGRDMLPVIREFPSRPLNSSRGLLGRYEPSGHAGQASPDVATPAIVSEVHLDAQADDQPSTEPRLAANAINFGSSHTSDRWNTSDVIQSLLGWLKWTTRVVEPASLPAFQSAEDHLRVMLERSADEHTSLPVA